MGKDVQPLQSVKTSILAELTVMSGLGDIYIKMMNLLCYYVHLIIVYCGGINPYTLTARLGPRGLAHHEDSSRLDPTARSFAQGNKTWRSSLSVRIGIDTVLSMAIVTD